MAVISIIRARGRQGRRIVERLEGRGEASLDASTSRDVARIVDRVRRGGDRALCRAVRRYDGTKVRGASQLCLPVPPAEESARELEPSLRAALERMIASVQRYHEHQARHQEGFRLEESGVELVELRHPLARVGLYVPGGRATYPSTVVMTAVPARLAGVESIAVATPPRSFHASAALRYILARLDIGEVWGMGGAHAIAALAYGTESVRRVDKIAGPGNRWVTAAKHQVSADVAIDGLAGPSEVLIIAAEGADPELLAADLLAQAEHDPLAMPLLVTPGRRLGRQVRRALERQLAELSTRKTARASLARQGAVLRVADMEEALALAERLAPEHLQLVGPAAEELAERVRAAGAVFVGASTPEVFGDYLAGPSHVLPTGGTARFASALGVDDFVRRSHRVRFKPHAAARCAEDAARLADVEGLPAHAASARLRAREGSS